MKNEALDAVLSELEAAGVADPIVARGSRHLQVRWQAGNTTRFYTVAASPSDWRGPHNARAETRRMLRADGFLKDEPDRSTPPAKALPAWQIEIESLKRRVAQLEAKLARV